MALIENQACHDFLPALEGFSDAYLNDKRPAALLAKIGRMTWSS